MTGLLWRPDKAHNLKAAGSNPAPATTLQARRIKVLRAFYWVGAAGLMSHKPTINEGK